MTIQRMVELLEIEHECMLRGSHDDCDRDCANCELVQDDMELHEMYTSVISMLKEQEAVEPEVEVLNEIDKLYRCPKCHKHFFYEKQKYCDKCGQAVKWDA